MTSPQFILAAHAASTLAMVGLIWFVQIVHYPMFLLVGEQAFQRYERVHQQRTTLVVGPLMLIELTTAVWLAFQPPEGAGWMAWLGIGLVGLIWASTALIQVPRHRQLERGLDAEVARRLVRSNWIRTLAWSGRGVLALALMGLGGE